MNDLKEKYPKLFEEGYIEISIPDGWLPLADKLLADITATNKQCHVLQMKEKFGQLRCYLVGEKELQDMAHKAQAESGNICEICGQPGKVRVKSYSLGGGWLKALCDVHSTEMGYDQKEM
jgi:hypothetical protein